MLKAKINSKIHQNLFRYWFTLWHFAINNPVGNSNSIPSSTTLGSGSGSASGLVSSTLSSVSSSFSLVSSSATDSRTLITQNQTAQKYYVMKIRELDKISMLLLVMWMVLTHENRKKCHGGLFRIYQAGTVEFVDKELFGHPKIVP